ncbi:MAG: phospho-N-acetylmuramoyl-pentapeptide-transferase [Oscillospiraceae bacterium]|nr:phospho-N-acetylmuramoyl-pentapeptide-transferase [Oscillospiraceae bacterium]
MMTVKLISAFVLAFLFSTAFGKYYIPWLRKQKAGQEIKSNGPTWHMSKSGTPTMGGVMFIVAIGFVLLTVGFEGMLKGNYVHIFVYLFALVFGAIGFLDDWEKLKKKQNLGLTAKMKFLLQLAAALVFVLLMRQIGYLSPNLYIPFVNKVISMPEWLYFVFAAFVIVGTVNAVNITDGVDGLASGTSIPVALFFVAVTYLWGSEYLELGIFASALVGGLMGFLVYNFNPAQVFMGDTGSLFLGGAVAALAFAYDMPLILITLGVMYIIETLSDIIQVGYFKLSHGKRVFRMAPFHHHLEMGGWTGKKWKEKELFVLFTGISLVFAIISFIGVFHRYVP